MKKINTLITSIFAFVLLSASSFIAVPVLHATAIGGNQFAANTSMPAPTTEPYTCDGKTKSECLQQNPIIQWISFFVNMIAAIVGVGAVIMVIVAGLQYSSARDNAQSIQAAKQKLFNVLIGLAAFVFLYSFMQWLIPGGVF